MHSAAYSGPYPSRIDGTGPEVFGLFALSAVMGTALRKRGKLKK